MKLKLLILNFSFLILTACGVTKPVSVAHVERIEERVMPIPVGADTIEIELCRDTRLECPMTRKGQNTTSTACPTFDLQPSTVNTQNIKTCLLGRDFAQQKQDHYVKEKSSYVFLSKKPTSTASPQSVHSVRNANSVRISSTRGINISRHETDTSTRIKLTLRPDTVFVPYTNHIRSDTIVVPDRVCQQKLNRSNMTNLFLILILIMIIIIFLKNRMTR